jgi:glycosyltransferase involved in cell wall biosynthesis
MRLLLVTEKCDPTAEQRDGGARLVASLSGAFGDAVDVLQFDTEAMETGTGTRWRRRYPVSSRDRFQRRLANADYIAQQVRAVADGFTHVLFVHTSMQFGFGEEPLHGVRTWTFPMFLTPSYEASGECVPAAYTAMERRVLATTDRVLTPSRLERRQLIERYGVPEARIRVVPRGVERTLLTPRCRQLSGPLRVCSVGSIKPQKNTLRLLDLFGTIRARHPGAQLLLVGPEQDAAYARQVRQTVARYGLSDAVTFAGFIPPGRLADALAEQHLHLSASSCETFGRAIFETLASGLPNLAPLQQNAAAEYLRDAPYARFYAGEAQALAGLDAILRDYPTLSAMAAEVGELFDDALLRQLLAAELRESEILAVSDFDGTLFHKGEPERTRRSVAAFQRYPGRVVCSARALPDLLAGMAREGVTADYTIGWSGAVIADGQGRILSQNSFSESELLRIQGALPAGALPLSAGAGVLQFKVEGSTALDIAGVRLESYQGTTFVGRWSNSKLHAVHRLLRHIGWQGRVRAFGDGPFDLELLTWFDGTWIRPVPCRDPHIRTDTEIRYASA